MLAAIVAIFGPALWNSRNLRTRVALEGASDQMRTVSPP
jgi:hypothetical protein